VLESVEESLADGIMEPVEAEQIRKEWEDLKSAGEMLVVNCERQAGIERPAELDEVAAGPTRKKKSKRKSTRAKSGPKRSGRRKR
jgi:hypothetical protein